MNFFYAKFSVVPNFDTNMVINQLKYLHKDRWACNQSVVLDKKVLFTDKIIEPYTQKHPALSAVSALVFAIFACSRKLTLLIVNSGALSLHVHSFHNRE